MNIDIFNYVKNARKAGMGDDKIKEGLLQAGWPVHEIEDALKSLGQSMPPPIKPKWHPTSAQKWIAIIGVIAILGMAGAYAYVSYLANKNYEEVVRQAQKAEEAMKAIEQNRAQDPSTSSRQSFDFARDWQTYRNEEYGFELKYPNTLILEEEKNKTFDGRDNIKLFASGFFIEMNLEAIGIENCDMPTSKNITINGIKMSREDCGGIITYQFDKDENSFFAFLNSEIYDVETFDQILSTFRFTK